MKIVYTGPLGRPQTFPDGTRVERGVPVDVPDDVAAELIARPDWEPAGPPPADAVKAVHVAYAQRQGLDVDGLTKADVIDAYTTHNTEE